jgi:hypothetical protein
MPTLRYRFLKFGALTGLLFSLAESAGIYFCNWNPACGGAVHDGVCSSALAYLYLAYLPIQIGGLAIFQWVTAQPYTTSNLILYLAIPVLFATFIGGVVGVLLDRVRKK